MTTKVTVDAHAGWPVKVVRVNSEDGAWQDVETVPGMQMKEFFIWDGCDLLISELPMPTYQERVVAEEKYLSEKLNKLSAFIHGERFAALAAEDRSLMLDQACHMAAYADVLRLRIARF